MTLPSDGLAVVNNLLKQLKEGVPANASLVTLAFLGISRVGKTTMLDTMAEQFLETFRPADGSEATVTLNPESPATALTSGGGRLQELRSRLRRHRDPSVDLPRDIFDGAIPPTKIPTVHRWVFDVVRAIGTQVFFRMADPPGAWLNNAQGWEFEAMTRLIEAVDIVAIPIDTAALLQGDRDLNELRNAPSEIRAFFQYLSTRPESSRRSGWLFLLIPIRCEWWRWDDAQDADGNRLSRAVEAQRIFDQVKLAYRDLIDVVRQKWPASEFVVTPVETLGSVYHHRFADGDELPYGVFRKKSADASVKGVDTEQPVLHVLSRILAVQDANRPRLLERGWLHNLWFGVRQDIIAAAELVRRKTKGAKGQPPRDGFGYL
ncbi:hypothetical protein [Dactylosporangium darangshiense]|uniref:hypothetical protein n=1 Tax=Dactylosporangium darangshiense TaxID=579108 RepID=UPI0031E6F579